MSEVTRGGGSASSRDVTDLFLVSCTLGCGIDAGAGVAVTLGEDDARTMRALQSREVEILMTEPMYVQQQ